MLGFHKCLNMLKQKARMTMYALLSAQYKKHTICNKAGHKCTDIAF